MHVIKTYENNDIIIYQIYYNRYGHYDTIVVYHKKGSIITRIKTKIDESKNFNLRGRYY